MCWATDIKEFMKPRIANTDIAAVKIVELKKNRFGRTGLFAPYFNNRFRYKPGKVYHEKISPQIDDDDYLEIHRGLHCFASVKKAKKVYLKHSPDYLLNYALVSAIIPKGTKYFINEGDEIVAEALKIVL